MNTKMKIGGLAALLCGILFAAACGAVPASAATPPVDCHPSYTGACVPVDVDDVDCEDGGGNGPEYVAGPVDVVGEDIYGLDHDGDGTGCEDEDTTTTTAAPTTTTAPPEAPPAPTPAPARPVVAEPTFTG